eukprot:14266963-Alexandrium_andersonii.AAC.1
MILKCDGEPAILELAKLIRDERTKNGLKTILEQTPRYSGASLGSMGNAQRQLQGQIRTLRAEAESRIGCSVTPDTQGWPWMVRHSGWLLE